MTVQSDLQKSVASAQSLMGSYGLFAESTDDKAAKTMFKELAQDMQRHVDALNSRISYLEKNNPMYQQKQQSKK